MSHMLPKPLLAPSRDPDFIKLAGMNNRPYPLSAGADGDATRGPGRQQ